MIDLESGKTYKTRWITTKGESKTSVRVGLKNIHSYMCEVFIDGIYTDPGYIDRDGKLFINGFDTMLEIYFEDQMEFLPIGYQRSCDCGGYIVYNNWSKEYHSSWCKVNR